MNLDIPYSSSHDIFVSYVKVHGPRPLVTFKILLVEIFSLKQRAGQILSATMEKVGFRLFKKNSFMFLQTITSSFV